MVTGYNVTTLTIPTTDAPTATAIPYLAPTLLHITIPVTASVRTATPAPTVAPKLPAATVPATLSRPAVVVLDVLAVHTLKGIPSKPVVLMTVPPAIASTLRFSGFRYVSTSVLLTGGVCGEGFSGVAA